MFSDDHCIKRGPLVLNLALPLIINKQNYCVQLSSIKQLMYCNYPKQLMYCNYPENLGAWARFGGPVPPWPQPRTATGYLFASLTDHGFRGTTIAGKKYVTYCSICSLSSRRIIHNLVSWCCRNGHACWSLHGRQRTWKRDGNCSWWTCARCSR